MISYKGKKYILLLRVEESFEDTFLHIFKNTTIDSRERGWATQSAPPVLLYYFILCLPVVHPG